MKCVTGGVSVFVYVCVFVCVCKARATYPQDLLHTAGVARQADLKGRTGEKGDASVYFACDSTSWNATLTQTHTRTHTQSQESHKGGVMHYVLQVHLGGGAMCATLPLAAVA